MSLATLTTRFGRARRGGVLCMASWLLLALVIPAPAAAQQASSVVGRYHLDVWRSQDNVRLAYTSNLVQTRDGYLWLSSQSGLARFDGFRFKVFDGTNSPVLKGRPRLLTYPLLEDGRGNLWIGSDVGMFSYDGRTMRAAAVDSVFRTDLLNAAKVDREGTLWGVTRSGRVFSMRRGGTLREVPGPIGQYRGNSIIVDGAGDVWVVSGEDAVYRVREGRLSRVAFAPGTLGGPVNVLYGARDGSIWLGTSTALLQWREGRLKRFALPRRGAMGGVSAIAQAPDGTVWIGTHGAGLHWFDGTRFTSVTSRDGLSDDRVIDILPDRSGNVWVATRDGLNRFRPLPFDVFTSRNGLPVELPGGMVRDTAGGIWLAPPSGGLLHGTIGPSGPRLAHVEGVTRSERVIALARARRGGIWVGERRGVVTRFVGTGAPGELVARGLPPVTDVLEDADGALWIATWRGVFRLQGGRLRLLTARHGLPDDHALRLFRDSHRRLWAATRTGVARAVGEDEDRFAPVRIPAGSVANALVFFEAPRGSVWVGSDEGLARLTGGRRAFLSVAHGLPERSVGAGEMDGAGNLWLGQLGGLTRVKIEELAAVADGRAAALREVATYEALDGLPGGDPGSWPHPWSFRDAAGKLWFAMTHGIVAADPAKARRPIHAPVLRVEEIAVDGVDVPPRPRITLAPDARRLEVRYTGVDLTDGPGVRFRHRMDGFDTAWVEVGTQRVASYTSLAPGRYRFRVAARDGHGEWGAAEARVDVLVRAPLYRQGWFVALVGVALALALWAMHRAVLRTQSAAMLAERSRLAREIHDSLLQGFGGVALELHAASMKLELPPTRQAHLERVLLLIDRTLTQAREVVWDIRHTGLRDEDLATACARSANRILENSPTTVAVATRGRARLLPGEIHAQCLGVVEEALTNVRKHARAAHVQVTFNYGWTRLVLSIADDGIGFDPSAVNDVGRHMGLVGIQERAARMGARVSLRRGAGNGSVVTVVIPYRRWRSAWRGRR